MALLDYMRCDDCGSTEYSEGNPFVEVRVPRPSDAADLCCILAGCWTCFPGGKTPEQWANYIESREATVNGHYWLS